VGAGSEKSLGGQHHRTRKTGLCIKYTQKPQFLLLRALWDINLQSELKIGNWLEEAYIADAVSLLDGYSDWKRYLESFSHNIEFEQRPFPNLGPFTLVKYSQLEVEATKKQSSSPSVLVSPWSPAKKDEQKVLYPPTEDEQIVNTALLNFLTAVTIAHPSVRLRWCVARKALQFDCKNEIHGAVTYQARTDGYLRGHNHSTAYAIIEVKPFIRGKKTAYKMARNGSNCRLDK
jgi:hypothetical protein